MKSFSVVTGASNGIGLELARKLAARGHDLVLVSRDQSKLDKAAAAIAAAHPGLTIHTLAADLAAPSAARRVFEHTEQLGVEVDVLINNAGVGLYGEHVELEPEVLARMIQLNVISLCELCALYGREMQKRGRGRILNVASTAAYQPTPFFAAYGASKAFVLNFSEALAKELEDHGVSVSCLSPGPTDTGFFGDMDRRGVHASYFAKSSRHDAGDVAQIGLDTLFSGRLSKVVGSANYWRAWSARLAPRSVVASIAKGMMRSSGAKPAAREQARSGE
jgi:short-subunit dehydrogenase